MTFARKLFVFSTLLLAALSTHAQVYKCVEDKTGRISFSDIPCHGKTSGSHIDATPNTLDYSGSREQALKSEVQTLREKLREQDSRVNRETVGRTQADLQAARIDTKACEDARWYYESESRTNPNNKAAIEAKRAAMYGACGMKEPDRVEVINRQVVPATGNAPYVKPSPFTHCDNSGCWDSAGARYQRSGPDTFIGPRGSCRVIGNSMHCP